MSNDNHQTNEIFQGLTIDDEIDPAYQAQLRHSVLETFRRTDSGLSRGCATPTTFWRRIPIVTLGAGIAASLLIGTIGWYASRPSGPSDISFTEVVQRVQGMDAVQYRQTITLVAPDQSARTIIADVVNVDAPQWQIIKSDGQVLDPQPAPASTQAVRAIASRPLVRAPASSQPAQENPGNWNVIDQLVNLASGSVVATRVRGTINDRPAVEFCVDQDQQTTQVWVDAQTRLPVRVDQTSANKTGSVTASNLQWTPKDLRKLTVLHTILHPRSAADPGQNGKILVVPTGGNIDNMPMMAIPPGCKILIPGTQPSGSKQPSVAPDSGKSQVP